MILCFFWWTHSFPGLPLLCWASPLRVSERESAPVLSLRTAFLKPALPHPAPAGCRQMWAQELLLGWEVPFSAISVLSFSILPSRAVSLFSPLRFQSFSDLSMRGSLCVETSSPHVSLLQGFSYPSQNNLSPFSYLTPMKLTCLSGSLRPSASIQKMFCGSCSTCRWFFNIIVRRRCSPILFSAILKVFWNRCLEALMGALKSDHSVNV